MSGPNTRSWRRIDGWWYRVDPADGSLIRGNKGRPPQRYAEPIDYRRNCSHSLMEGRRVCAWCGLELGGTS